MLALPQWFHELATLTTLGLAAGWLVAQWLRVASGRIGQAGKTEPGCARCDRNPLPASAPPRAGSGRRSKQLRVL